LMRASASLADLNLAMTSLFSISICYGLPKCLKYSLTWSFESVYWRLAILTIEPVSNFS
jgi:hypothetical protein